jgi:hypothetical protein
MSELAELLKQSAFEWLIDRLVRRIEQGQCLDRGTVTLMNATETQRRAVDDLLGRPSSSGKNLSVNLEKLSNRLHADLYSLVTNIRGPLQNRMAEREAEDKAWSDVIEDWHARLQNQTFATAWLNATMKDGTLKRFSERDAKKAHALLERAWQVLQQDTHEDVLLASLAARITGDSHALDRDGPWRLCACVG